MSVKQTSHETYLVYLGVDKNLVSVGAMVSLDGSRSHVLPQSRFIFQQNPLGLVKRQIFYLVCAELFNLDPHLTNTTNSLDKSVVNKIAATPEGDLNTLEPVQLSRIGILVGTELPTGI